MVKDILEGTINNILDKEKELYSKRMKICRNCKLYSYNSGIAAICNPYLYLNSETNEISKTKKEGFYRGCGCILSSKTRVKNGKCPTNKW